MNALHDLSRQKEFLLDKLKAETVLQLKSIKAEDPERFLESVERAESLIKQIQSLDRSAGMSLMNQEIKKILFEIMQCREEISIRLPTLQQKIRERLQIQRNQTKVQQTYHSVTSAPPPSVFFDRKN